MCESVQSHFSYFNDWNSTNNFNTFMNRKELLSATRWMHRNLQISTDHLTPTLKLSLITPECPMWMSRPENCPFPDPYWGFYWPGGQALTRHVLENEGIAANKSVLDIGCGCGSSSAAAILMKASKVIVNDIDKYALLAAARNIRRNVNNSCDDALPAGSCDINFVADNLLEKGVDPSVEVIFLGDMFYDDQFADAVFQWLTTAFKINPCLQVLIGDPGRHGLRNHMHRLKSIQSYPLPPGIWNGMHTANVYQIFE